MSKYIILKIGNVYTINRVSKESINLKARILYYLEIPMTASDLQEYLGVQNFGTIHYHLKNLEKENKIKSVQLKNIRGKPVYYFLRKDEDKFKDFPNNYIKYIYDIKNKKREVCLKILSKLENSPSYVKEIESLFDKALDLDEAVNILYNSEYVKLKAEITKKGEKFLRDNSK